MSAFQLVMMTSEFFETQRSESEREADSQKYLLQTHPTMFDILRTPEWSAKFVSLYLNFMKWLSQDSQGEDCSSQ